MSMPSSPAQESAESHFRAVFGPQRQPRCGNAWALREGDVIRCQVATSDDGRAAIRWHMRGAWPVLHTMFAVADGPHRAAPVHLFVLANPQSPRFRAIARVVLGFDVSGQAFTKQEFEAHLSRKDFMVELGHEGQRPIVKRLLSAT